MSIFNVSRFGPKIRSFLADFWLLDVYLVYSLSRKKNRICQNVLQVFTIRYDYFWNFDDKNNIGYFYDFIVILLHLAVFKAGLYRYIRQPIYGYWFFCLIELYEFCFRNPDSIIR